MLVMKNYDQLLGELKSFLEYHKERNNGTRIEGLLFAQPNNFTKDEIFSGIEYFDTRSGEVIDFFFVGYLPDYSEVTFPKVVTVNGNGWSFDAKTFNQVRQETEQKTKWKYSGSVELVLFNTYLDSKTNKVKLDFSDAIAIDLRKAKDDKHISSVGEIFEKIFSIAEKIESNNPTKEMSLRLIEKTGKKSLVNILFNLLPKAIQDDARKIYIYGTSDFQR